MAVAREENISLGYVWAQDALTQIPAVPTAGVSYRNASTADATMEAGQAYSAIYDSAIYNQMFWALTAVAKTMCEYGIMPFLSGQAYKQYARCIWTDGNVYKCSRDIAADESPYPTPKDKTTVWLRDGGEGGGGSIPAGGIVPFYNVTLGGTNKRNPIFWGESEPDVGWLVCDGGSDGMGGTVPDLRNRFIYGTATVSKIGQTGGATSVSPTIKVNGSTSQLTVGNTTLTVETLASHLHGASTHANTGGCAFGGGICRDNTDHYTYNTGGSQPHTHALTDPGHSHTASATVATVPPYIKLLFCVKLRAI